MVFTQKLLHTKAFTQRSLCTEAPLHEVTSWNWQQFFGKNPWQELSGTHLLPKKAVYFQQSSYSMTFFQFSKNIRNIFLKQVPVQKLSSPHCDEMEGREIWRSRRGASALKFGSAGSPRVRWQMRHERPRATRALWWGAPQTADPPTPGPEKHKKSFRRVEESFLDGIRVAHKRLQEHSPPRFGGYLKSEKSAVLTPFSDDFSLFERHKML